MEVYNQLLQNQGDLPVIPQKKINKVSLDKEREYRIYYNVKHTKDLEIRLAEGKAEIFGLEMTQFKTYTFQPGSYFYIYTWHGCKLELNVDDREFYEAPSDSPSPQITIANISLMLNEMRKTAQNNQQFGPRVLIMGRQYSGKSTVEKILVNYSCKLGWKPMIIDLDWSSNELLSGGCVGACQVKYQYPDNFTNEQNKIVYFTGEIQLNNTNFKKDLYLSYVKQLKKVTFAKLEKDLEVYQKKFTLDSQQQQYQELFANESKTTFSSGFFVNIPYFQSQYQEEIIPTIIEEFDINVILVLEEEFLFQSISRQYNSPTRHVLFSKTLGSVIARDNREIYIEQKNNTLLRQYFKGLNMEISCTILKIPIKEADLYRFVEKSVLGEVVVQAEKWDKSMLNIVKKVVGILHCTVDEQEDMEVEDTKDNKEKLLTQKLLSSPLKMIGHIDKISQNDTNIELLLPGSYFQQDIIKHPFIIGNLHWVGAAK